MITQQASHLQTHDLAFERDNRLLFKNIHLDLHGGDLLQVCGTNGCGKSTLLRLLAGYIQPEQGNITWQDQCIFTEADDYQAQLHYIGHQNGIKLNLSVLENLRFQAALNAKPFVTKAAIHVLTNVGLAHAAHQLAGTLSAGQKRRLALARLLSHPATLWILDEPMTALDDIGIKMLTDLLNHHLDNQGIVIMATHQSLPLTRPIQTLRLHKGEANA